MSSTPKSLVNSLRIYCQNVGKKHTWTVSLLETRRKSSDILLIQEPPWATVRYTASLTEKDGVPVKGPPIHPDWICMYLKGFSPMEDCPWVLAYVNRHVKSIKPKLHSD